jgi:hypothetical protein
MPPIRAFSGVFQPVQRRQWSEEVVPLAQLDLPIGSAALFRVPQ